MRMPFWALDDIRGDQLVLSPMLSAPIIHRQDWRSGACMIRSLKPVGHVDEECSDPPVSRPEMDGRNATLSARAKEVFDVINVGWLSAQEFPPDHLGNPNGSEVDLLPRISGTKIRMVVDQQMKGITTAFPIP
ncbi:MAG: hypothetical protein EOP06_09480 [Proteobacteria bacterium]|nr:MAG: hypothetical protein EOP06_09480 [Pseudomonadota bacterium]